MRIRSNTIVSFSESHYIAHTFGEEKYSVTFNYSFIVRAVVHRIAALNFLLFMTTADIQKKASRLYPISGGRGHPREEQAAYVKGYMDAVRDMSEPNDGDFFEKVAKGLKELWPSGEKSSKYPWQESVPNLVKRLQFIWKERGLKDLYTVDDCMQAGRRYLSQFERDVTYMQTLKYFVFKQEKSVASNGRITYTYKSSLADLLDGQRKEEWMRQEMEGTLI